MKTKQGTIYIAEDGTEFVSEQALVWHELNVAIRTCAKRFVEPGNARAALSYIFEVPYTIPAARAYLEYAKLKWPEEFNK